MKKNWLLGTVLVAFGSREREAADAPRASSSITGWSRPRRRSASGRAGASRSASSSAAGFPASSSDCSRSRPASKSSSRIATTSPSRLPTRMWRSASARPRSLPPANRCAGSSWSPPASRTASRFPACASATSSSRTCSASAARSSPSTSWAWCWRSRAASTCIWPRSRAANGVAAHRRAAWPSSMARPCWSWDSAASAAKSRSVRTRSA